MELVCKNCGKKTDHYGKGMCKGCYMKDYMKKNYKKMNITTMLITKDLLQFIHDKKLKGESLDTTLRRMLNYVQ